MRHIILFVLALLISQVSVTDCFAEGTSGTDPVAFALSSRHGIPTLQELEQMAGGADELVAKLLVLRHQERPPFAAIRAEKLLLHYSNRQEVQEALLSDVQTEKYSGLARVVAMNIDSVPSQDLRVSLARGLVKRAEGDKGFEPFVKVLQSSSDQAVKKVAVGGN